jgi:transposase-like protein
MKRKYDDEFKRNIMRKVLDGQPVRSVSQEPGVNDGLIHKWKKAFLQNGNGIQSSSELNENLVLKKRIRELEAEVEILKKAPLIFGRGS